MICAQLALDEIAIVERFTMHVLIAVSPRIDKDYPELGRDLIEDTVISWLEMEYVPQAEQMDKFEELVDLWLESHQRRARWGKDG